MSNYNRNPCFSSAELLRDPILGDNISVDGDGILEDGILEDGILDDDYLPEGSYCSTIFRTADAVAFSMSSRATIPSRNDEIHTCPTEIAIAPVAAITDEKYSNTVGQKRGNSEELGSQSWGEWDVPLGRAQEVREHIGNVRFRGIVEKHRSAYLQATSKSQKTSISLHVQSIITRNGGRFLDQNKRKGEWFEISQEKSLAKISQSLRNGTCPVRKLKVPPQQSTRISTSFPTTQVLDEPATETATLLTRNRRQDDVEGIDLSGMYISVPYSASSVSGNQFNHQFNQEQAGFSMHMGMDVDDMNENLLSFINSL